MPSRPGLDCPAGLEGVGIAVGGVRGFGGEAGGEGHELHQNIGAAQALVHRGMLLGLVRREIERSRFVAMSSAPVSGIRAL